MKKHAILALLVAVALTLASCGGGASGGMQGMDHGGSGKDRATGEKSGEEGPGGMAGMDHESMEGMDHGSMNMGSGGMAAASEEMVEPNGEYSDKAFIDAMVPHHEGAVEMARLAQQQAEHEEIRGLSEDIISTQRAEIERLGEIREREFGSAESSAKMSGADMEAMGMSDTGELASADPFDKAFIDAMIPHHESAVAMANVALEKSENREVRRIAEDIVSAQKREISQMREWRRQWYPKS